MKGDHTQDPELPLEDWSDEADPKKKLVRVREPEEARNKAKQLMEAIAREVEKNQPAPGMIVAGGLNEAKAYVRAPVSDAHEPEVSQESARVRVLDPRHAETVKLDPRRVAKLAGEAGALGLSGEEEGEEPREALLAQGVSKGAEGSRKREALWILLAIFVGAALVGTAIFVGALSRPQVLVALPLTLPAPIIVAPPAEAVQSAEPSISGTSSAAPPPSGSAKEKPPKPVRPSLSQEIFQ